MVGLDSSILMNPEVCGAQAVMSIASPIPWWTAVSAASGGEKTSLKSESALTVEAN